jgi:hypothetical protein
LLGTLVVPGGLGALLLAALVGVGGLQSCTTTYDESAGGLTSSCDGHPVVNVVRPVAFILIAVAALLVPFVLLHVARRRAEAETAAPVVNRAGQPIG